MEELWEKMRLKDVLLFVRDPQYRQDSNISFIYRAKACVNLLFWAIGIGLGLSVLLGLISSYIPWDLDDHLFQEMLEDYPATMIVFLAVGLAPALEELVFRGPLWFFRNTPNFKGVFYLLTTVFALVHLSNFQNLKEIWLLTPILIAPQLNVGIFLGFIRVRFGLLWSIGFHAAYNGFLLAPVLFLQHLEIPIS